MSELDITSLPVQLATRLVLDSISYSNPLPEWFEILEMNYLAKDDSVRDKIFRYLRGTSPQRPFTVSLPNKAGNVKRWAVPSINDQIIYQACVSSIAELLDEQIDRKKVYSCRYNSDPNRLALMEDQIASWRKFQIETRHRCASNQCILQIDLENAFGSMDRAKVINFLRQLAPRNAAIDLLKILLDSFSAGEEGLPLVNDSVFYIGNAYLSELDKVIGAHTAHFIRFVDDYRIFGDSVRELESLLEKITKALRTMGFRINAHKLRLGSGEEYLEAVSTLQYAGRKSKTEHKTLSEEDSGYTDPAILGNVIGAKNLFEQIIKTLQSPEQYLHQGFGRFQTAAIRRMRLDSLIDIRKQHDSPQRVEFSRRLSQDRSAITQITRLLRTYPQDETQVWRTVWLLHLTKDIEFPEIKDKKLSADLKDTLSRIRTSSHVPRVVRLWAVEMAEFPSIPQSVETSVEELHECHYVDRGELCYGRQHNVSKAIR